MAPERLNPSQVEACLQSLNQWTLNVSESSIAKEWRFESYKKAIEMMVKVSELAESHDHHPEMVSAYTRIRVTLWTHDAHGLTSKDYDLAQAIDPLVAQEF